MSMLSSVTENYGLNENNIDFRTTHNQNMDRLRKLHIYIYRQ